jgi:hypothetical protein
MTITAAISGGRHATSARAVSTTAAVTADAATACRGEMKVATDRESRAVLKEMAAEWLKLAEAPVDKPRTA